MISELRARLNKELDHLVEEMTVHLPAVLGADQSQHEYQDTIALQQLIQERVQHLGKLDAGLASVHPDALFPDRVGFGSVVCVKDLCSDEDLAYTLMAGDRIDLDAGEISLASPVGQALLGRRPGDEVDVDTPQRRRRLRILSMTTLFERLDEAPPVQCA